jgi:hypothetical protein
MKVLLKTARGVARPSKYRDASTRYFETGNTDH